MSLLFIIELQHFWISTINMQDCQDLPLLRKIASFKYCTAFQWVRAENTYKIKFFFQDIVSSIFDISIDFTKRVNNTIALINF
jgi:hypothetical protein